MPFTIPIKDTHTIPIDQYAPFKKFIDKQITQAKSLDNKQNNKDILEDEKGKAFY